MLVLENSIHRIYRGAVRIACHLLHLPLVDVAIAWEAIGVRRKGELALGWSDHTTCFLHVSICMILLYFITSV